MSTKCVYSDVFTSFKLFTEEKYKESFFKIAEMQKKCEIINQIDTINRNV